MLQNRCRFCFDYIKPGPSGWWKSSTADGMANPRRYHCPRRPIAQPYFLWVRHKPMHPLEQLFWEAGNG